MTKPEPLKNKRKKELIQLICCLKGTIGNLKNLLIEYKATINIDKRRIVLLESKIRFLEKSRKTNPTYTQLDIKTRSNRSISAMRRNQGKRSKR